MEFPRNIFTLEQQHGQEDWAAPGLFLGALILSAGLTSLSLLGVGSLTPESWGFWKGPGKEEKASGHLKGCDVTGGGLCAGITATPVW